MTIKVFRGALIILIALMNITGCGHSKIISEMPEAGQSTGLPTFALASDFPADIVIHDTHGMSSMVFVVSTSTPAGVIAIDLSEDRMKLSEEFKGLVCPEGSGIPSRLTITNRDEGFLLTSTSIISFNPENGDIYHVASALEPIEIGEGFANSDGTDAGTIITPSYPGGIAEIRDRIFISSANYLRTQAPAVAAPGTVQVFSIGSDHTTERTGVVLTSGFNPTGLSVRNGAQLIIANSGVLDIIDARGVPQTPSSIDIADPETLEIIANIPIGMALVSFHDAAISIDGSLGFIGSAAYGHVYEIDFINRQVLRGLDNPIAVSDGADYITDIALSSDNKYLYAASFESSSVYPFDLSDPLVPRGDPFVVGYPSGATDENPSGANTGAGPIAVRPGIPGVDFDGPDLFVLTSYPGAVVAVRTQAADTTFNYDEPEETGYDTSTPPPPSGDDGDSCQGFAQAVHSVDYGEGAGFGQQDFPEIVLGPPRGRGNLAGSTHVLSLGRHGEIILDVGNCHAVDGPGPDFIVFENAFYIGGNEDAPYAEIGAVGVGNNPSEFIEFPCRSDALPYYGCAGWHPVLSGSSNGISPFDADSAGGEVFDLGEVRVEEARYIRIRDIGGNSMGGDSAGFDLDAIAVINGRINN